MSDFMDTLLGPSTKAVEDGMWNDLTRVLVGHLFVEWAKTQGDPKAAARLVMSTWGARAKGFQERDCETIEKTTLLSKDEVGKLYDMGRQKVVDVMEKVIETL